MGDTPDRGRKVLRGFPEYFCVFQSCSLMNRVDRSWRQTRISCIHRGIRSAFCLTYMYSRDQPKQTALDIRAASLCSSLLHVRSPSLIEHHGGVFQRCCMHRLPYSFFTLPVLHENVFLLHLSTHTHVCFVRTSGVATDNRAAGVRFGAEREPRVYLGGYGDKRRDNQVHTCFVCTYLGTCVWLYRCFAALAALSYRHGPLV